MTVPSIFRTSSDITGDVRKLPLAGSTAVRPYTGNFRMSLAITHYVRDWHDLYGIFNKLLVVFGTTFLL